MDAQALYLSILKVGLFLQISGVVAGLYQPTVGTQKAIGAYAAAVCFGLSLVLTLVLKARRYERTWYGGRAAAESVKTTAWRYITCSEPYLKDLSEKAVDELLLANLQSILDQRRYLANAIGTTLPDGPQITEKMRSARKFTTSERLALYLSQRTLQQKDWYGKNAAKSAKAEIGFFWGFISAQGLALIFAAIRIRFPEFLNLTGLSVAAGASILAWLQIKRHQELAQSYAVAAHELALVAEKGRHVSSEAELSAFVGDAEAAISREHTLWIARRDSP